MIKSPNTRLLQPMASGIVKCRELKHENTVLRQVTVPLKYIDRIWLWVYYNKIYPYSIYLIEGLTLDNAGTCLSPKIALWSMLALQEMAAVTRMLIVAVLLMPWAQARKLSRSVRALNPKP